MGYLISWKGKTSDTIPVNTQPVIGSNVQDTI